MTCKHVTGNGNLEWVNPYNCVQVTVISVKAVILRMCLFAVSSTTCRLLVVQTTGTAVQCLNVTVHTNTDTCSHGMGIQYWQD